MGWGGRARVVLFKVHQKSASKGWQKKRNAWLKFSKKGPLQRLSGGREREDHGMAAAAPLVVFYYIDCWSR